MLKETVSNFTRRLGNALAPNPSKALEEFNNTVLSGHDERIYIGGHFPDIQCYGVKKKEKVEIERIIIPWGDVEKSYFITRPLKDPNRSINLIFEGFFPRAD